MVVQERIIMASSVRICGLPESCEAEDPISGIIVSVVL
jgi:hypothetical protein